MKALEIIVYLAGNEWGNERMFKLAEEQFALHGDVENLRVTVYEHGGWYLCYGIIDGVIRVVSSANDGAVFPPDVDRYWERLRGAEWSIEVIRRGEKAA